jgi:hypothetical protein
MPVTINGTTGITTPAENTSALTVGSITGILKATSGVVAQAIAGTDYLTSTSGGAITLATAQTATGTAVDFTSIPSWVKRITVIFNGISTNGSSNPIIQIGAGSITSTGYTSHGGFAGTSGYSVSATTGIVLPMGSGPSNTAYGRASIELIGSNTWVGTVVFGMVQVGAYFGTSGGYVSLAGSLDRLRITTVNGTDTFDAGTINISYE